MNLKILLLLQICAICFLLVSTKINAKTVEKSQALDKTVSVNQPLCFNFDWKFSLGDIPNAQNEMFIDSIWQNVNLPHDWSVYGQFNEKTENGKACGFLPTGIGWYRKKFLTPVADGQVFIDFEGVYTAATAWLNGICLGKNHNGYLGFRYEITKLLKTDGKPNVLAVRADNRRVGSSRWYTGSGIYRNVNLIFSNPVHIPQYGIWITTPTIEKDKAVTHVETKISNSGAVSEQLKIITEIYNPKGKMIVAETQTRSLLAGDTITVKQDLLVKNPTLWSTEFPKLYKSICKILINNKLSDIKETHFGIRSIAFTPDSGMLLNGRKLFVKGVNFHHDLGCLGAAAFERGFERRLELIKEMGCNAVRLAHNPYHSSLLDQCDRMGILVFDEAYDKWENQFTGPDYPFEKAWKTDLQTFILRDRNHPSLFIWSLGNEQYHYQLNTPDFGVSQYKNMADFVKSIDPTRAVTCALFPGRANGVRYNAQPKSLFEDSEPAEMSFVMDVASCNYTHSFFEKDHKKYPSMVLLLSESNTNGGGESWFDYNHDYTVGQFYWGGFDYIGESTGWPNKGWASGLIDMTGYRKPASYYVQSFQSEKPMVYIAVKPQKQDNGITWNDVNLKWENFVSHWNWEPENKTVQVYTFSNAEMVELFLNGKSLGVKKMSDFPKMKMLWDVPFHPGELKAIAYNSGKQIASYTINTAGKPDRILLEMDRKSLDADGLDLVYITAKVVDSKGIIVPYFSGIIKFTVTGSGLNAGVDNGDMSSNESWQSNERSAFNGRVSMVVRTGRSSGKINIKAFNKDIKSGEISIKTY